MHCRLPRPRGQSALVEDLSARWPAAAPLCPLQSRRGGQADERADDRGRALGWVTDRRGLSLCGAAPARASHGRRSPTRGAGRSGAEVTGLARAPDCCLVNCYGEAHAWAFTRTATRRLRCPVLSISLGDDALFRVGGADEVAHRSRWLRSGDVARDGRPVASGLARDRPRAAGARPPAAERRAHAT